MSHSEDRHLDFVLKHYKEGAFDTQKAIGRFKAENGVRPMPRRRWNPVIYAMSAAAGLLIGVFLFMHSGSRQWTEISADASQQEFMLPDGTCVTLAQGSVLSYRMKDERRVKMEGKVFFDVARDEARPFEVDADGAFVRVLGTEFMVDAAEEDQTKVYVADGKVLFAKGPEEEGVILTKGMGATIEEGAEMPVVEEVADINSIAWQRGSFIFDQTPLKDVLDCLSGYYGVSFAAEHLDRCLSGEFMAEDLDLILMIIESALDVTIIKK